MTQSWWPTRVYTGEVVYPPRGTFGPHIQPCFQLVILHTGSVDLTYGTEIERHYAGTALLLQPGRVVNFEFAKDSPTRHSWISIYCDSLPDPLRRCVADLPRSIPLSQQMNRLVNEAVRWRDSPCSEGLLPVIGLHALSLYAAESLVASARTSSVHEAICLVERYVQSHYSEELTLADLARAANVSPEHLCRLFRAHRRQSPMAYLWEYRTRRALELLASTGLSVTDVAERCGFRTSYHLYQRVKQLTDDSPSAYRQRQKLKA